MIERPGAGRRETVQPSASWLAFIEAAARIGLAGGDPDRPRVPEVFGALLMPAPREPGGAPLVGDGLRHAVAALRPAWCGGRATETRAAPPAANRRAVKLGLGPGGARSRRSPLSYRGRRNVQREPPGSSWSGPSTASRTRLEIRAPNDATRRDLGQRAAGRSRRTPPPRARRAGGTTRTARAGHRAS